MLQLKDKVPTVENTVLQYWVKLTGIFENQSLFIQQKNGRKQLYRLKNGVNKRQSEVKTKNLPKLLPARLAQARVLKQFNVENTNLTIYIKNVNARCKTGNNKSILLTEMIILKIARKCPSVETPIIEKPVNR